MTTNYAQHLKSTQREKAKPGQVENNAGGFVFQLDPWQQLDRWLILGGEGGTYYVSERKLTRENAGTIEACLKLDAKRTVAAIVAVSQAGRAPKQDSALFALALAAAGNHPEAYAAIPLVCRIPTHLFQFIANCEALGKGWGRGLKKAVAKWYGSKTAEQLARDIAKYPQRNGWSHRDLLRLSHWDPNPDMAAVARYIVAGSEGMGERTVVRKKNEATTELAYPALALPEYLADYEELKTADENRTITLILKHKFTHEMIDSKHKNSVDVWAALLDAGMPMTALLRNLGKMSAVGLLKPLSKAVSQVAERLVDQEALRKARVHPISVLTALRVYRQGHGDKGSLKWDAAAPIIDALDSAFYLAFGLIPKTGKSFLIGLDVSGSMDSPASGVQGLSCREASAVMAMATVRTESNYHVLGFTAKSVNRFSSETALTDLGITARMRLDDVVKKISGLPFGNTDCALPMLEAAEKKWDVDVFQVYTDNETWAGGTHPYQALKDYRKAMNKPHAKLVVCGMTSTGFSIADPSDAGSMDVVGMDSATPAVIAEFVKQ